MKTINSRRSAAAIPCIALLVLSLGWTSVAQVRNPLPVPNVGDYRTLKCDFHMHTVFSDGEVWPTTRVLEAYRDGIDVISLTDHDQYNPNKNDVSTDLRRPLELARNLANQLGILLVPGVEITRGDIHHNALFVTDPNVFAELELEPALLKAREQKAFVFWNHPGWRTPTTMWLPEIDALHAKGLIQGVELVNGPYVDPVAFTWAKPKNLVMLGTSDIHTPMPEKYGEHPRPVTLVFTRTADLEGLREALFARRTACWASGQVWGDPEWLGGLWTNSVSVVNPVMALSLKARSTALRFHNRSAMPYSLVLRQAPEWLRLGNVELKPGMITAARLTITENAPAGEHSIEAEVEITNLHTEPGKNLFRKIPLRITITP